MNMSSDRTGEAFPAPGTERFQVLLEQHWTRRQAADAAQFEAWKAERVRLMEEHMTHHVVPTFHDLGMPMTIGFTGVYMGTFHDADGDMAVFFTRNRRYVVIEDNRFRVIEGWDELLDRLPLDDVAALAAATGQTFVAELDI